MAGKWSGKKKLVAGLALAAVLAAPSAVLAQIAFDDVPAGHPHEAGIGYVSTKGITQGCDADSYCPQDPLTRGQMATFLFRASGNDPATPPSVNADTLDGLDSTQLLGQGGGGPAGPTGPAGPAGPPGLANVEHVSFNFPVSAASAISAEEELLCPAGKSLTGGGAASTSTEWVVNQSAPSSLPAQGWVGKVRRVGGTGGTTLVIYAICATIG